MVGVYEVAESLDATEPENTTKLLARKLAAKASQPSVVLLVRHMRLTQVDGKELVTSKTPEDSKFVVRAHVCFRQFSEPSRMQKIANLLALLA